MSSAAGVRVARAEVGVRDDSKGAPNDGNNKGTSSTSIPVNKLLLRFLVGKCGSIKEKLEKDNGVKLQIPSSAQAKTSSAVVITGSEESVEAASKDIHKILDDAVKGSLEYTHFISLPLATHASLLDQVTNFRDSVLGSVQPSLNDSNTSNEDNTSYSGIHRSIFVKPATFHLTVLMLKLWNEELVQTASSILQNMRESFQEALEQQPVTLDIQGVECFQGSPEKAHVLYARIEDSEHTKRLVYACQVLTDAFVAAGLVMDRDIGQTLKLHATLMNTRHRKISKNKRHSRKRVPFDARDIIAKYGDWNWGQHAILEAHLSERFEHDENGYYRCVSAIPFPRPSP